MMHANALSPWIATVVVMMAIVGCARSGSDADAPDGPRDAGVARPVSVVGPDWVLEDIGGERAQPADERARPRLRLGSGDERRVTGSTGVNHLSGTYELSGAALQFGPMITTKRAGPPELMRQEAAFLKVLEMTATAQARGASMVLHDAAGQVLARFEASAAAP